MGGRRKLEERLVAAEKERGGGRWGGHGWVFFHFCYSKILESQIK